MISDTQVLKVPECLIEDCVENYHYFFNPNGHQGPFILFGDALDIFEHCRKGSSIAEISVALPHLRARRNRLEEIIIALGRLEIIDLGEKFSRKLSMERKQKKKRQMMVWFQLTDACNLRCPYCYIHKKPTHMDPKLGQILVSKIVSDAGRAGFEEIIFKLAGGEPTLRWSEGRELIDWTEKKFSSSLVRVKFHIITNATLMPKSLIDYLIARKLSISVSLDGVGKWHDRQRFYTNGCGSFSDVEKNLETLLSHSIHAPILTTITKNNLHGITELAEYCWQRDLSFRFSLYREATSSTADLQSDNADVISELLKCYSWMENHLPDRDFSSFHQFGDINFRMPKLRNCGIGTNGVTLTSNGQFCLCQYEMSDPLGDIQTSDFTQVIKNQKRFSLSENRVDHYPICAECRWRFVCAGGCPYLTKHQYGTFQHASPYCEVYQAILPILLRLHVLQLVQNFKKKGGDLHESRNDKFKFQKIKHEIRNSLVAAGNAIC